MPEHPCIDPRGSALLVMDYEVDTLTRFMTAARSTVDAIACVPELIAMAPRRRRGDGPPCGSRIPARPSRGQPP